MTSAEPSRVAVVGTGLIGTSIAMAAVRAGYAVAAYDRDRGALDEAAARTNVQPASSVEGCVRGARFVFVCTPIESIAEMAAAALDADDRAIVSDVGSVKSQVLAEVEATVSPSVRPRFVGGHPMGGSERTGPDGASASLIEGVAWVLTPGAWSDPGATAALESYVAAIGAHPVRMSADRHDRLVAVVSHLPQVASSALMNLVIGGDVDDADALMLAGTGFRDVTRLAGSDPRLWTGILQANRDALIDAIDLYVEALHRLRTSVAEGRASELEAGLERARAARAELGAKPRVRAGMALLQVPVPDRPGVLAQMTAALGKREVNIEDLQIVHSPWEPAGVVHLTVLAESADTALQVLAAGEFHAVRVA